MESSHVPEDILTELSRYIKDGKTWKSFVLTNKFTSKMNTKEKIRGFANHLTTLVEKFPDKPWNWNHLSSTLSIPINFVLTHLELQWDWHWLSRHVPWQVVLDHKELPWDWDKLSENPSLPFDFVLAHPKLRWNWEMLSSNPSISFDFVLAHPELDWDWYKLSRNPSL